MADATAASEVSGSYFAPYLPPGPRRRDSEARDKLATALDPLTANCLHISDRPELMQEIKGLLHDAYVVYGLRALEFHDAADASKEDAASAPAPLVQGGPCGWRRAWSPLP